MDHPIHLHGHKFWVLGSGSGFSLNASTNVAAGSLTGFQNLQYRDVTLVPRSGWLALRYQANTPGAWMLQCQNQWNLWGGMAVVMVEGGQELENMVHKAGPSMVGSNLTATSPPRHSASPTESSTPRFKNAGRVLTTRTFLHEFIRVCITALLLYVL